MGFAGFNEETMRMLQQEATEREKGQEQAKPNEGDVKQEIIEDTEDINLVDIDENETKEEPAAKEPEGDSEDKEPEGDTGEESEEDAGESTEDESDEESEIVEGDVNDEAFILETLQKSGVDPAEAEARIIKDGDFTPEFVQELKDSGVDPNLVDAYKGKFDEAMAEAKTAQEAENSNTDQVNAERKALNDYIFASVGGEDKFNKMAAVLKANMSEGDIEIINAKLRSDSKALIKEGMAEAVAKYKTATGRDTLAMSGDQNSTGEPAFEFMTKGDYHRIIVTEKYKTDPTYAAKVDADRLKSRNMDAKSLLPGTHRNIRGGRMYKV